MIVVRTKQFSKATVKLPPQVKHALALRLGIFMKDPSHKLLNNHALQGSKRGYRSINITGDYRLIYEQHDENTMRLVDIDTHSNLY